MNDLNYYLPIADTSRRLKLDDRMLCIVLADPMLCGFEFKRGDGLSRFGRPIVLYRPLTGGEWKPYCTGPRDLDYVGVTCAIAARLHANEPSKATLCKAIYATGELA